MEYIDTGKCIWCKLEKPVVSFGKKPHIIPHALNANYIGTDICNKCNTFFGTSTSNKPSVDLVFKEVFNAFRLSFSFEYLLECMDPAAVCAGVSSVMGSGEHGLDMLVLAVVGDACLVAAHHVIEVVDPGW